MSIVDEIAELLRQKQQLDGEQSGGVGYSGGEGQYTKRQRWLGEAVELLLRVVMAQEKRERKP